MKLKGFLTVFALLFSLLGEKAPLRQSLPDPPVCLQRLWIDGASIPLQDGDIALLSDLGFKAERDGEGSFTIAVGEKLFQADTAFGGLYTDGKRCGRAYVDRNLLYVSAIPILSAGPGRYLRDGNNHYYASADYRHIPNGIKAPVLMYHAVSNDTWGIKELFVKPEALEKQLAYLSENHYSTLTFEDCPSLGDFRKPVFLTFDDGYEDNYTYLFPLLKKYNCKATVFIITEKIGTLHYLTRDQILEMDASGLVSIQSHTLTHPKLGELDEARQRLELQESQLNLAHLTRKVPTVLCYPSGSYNKTTLRLTRSFYSLGIKMNGRLWTSGSDPMLIPRYYVSRSTSLSDFTYFLPKS